MLICVTNRKLCKEDFLLRIQRLAQARPYALMLREKDLDVSAYEELAWRVKEVCEQYGVQLIIHQHSLIAKKLHISHLHLPMPTLRTLPRDGHSLIIGASIHSVAERRKPRLWGLIILLPGIFMPLTVKRAYHREACPFCVKSAKRFPCRSLPLAELTATIQQKSVKAAQRAFALCRTL